MKIIEERHEGEPWVLWKIGNLTALDQDAMKSVGAAWGFKEGGKWSFVPRKVGNVSLYYNSILFIRFCWPLGVFFAVRWSGATDKKALFQTGFGWKLNGRLAVLFRVQSDKTSAAGVTGPNVGQATGWEFGTH